MAGIKTIVKNFIDDSLRKSRDKKRLEVKKVGGNKVKEEELRKNNRNGTGPGKKVGPGKKLSNGKVTGIKGYRKKYRKLLNALSTKPSKEIATLKKR